MPQENNQTHKTSLALVSAVAMLNTLFVYLRVFHGDIALTYDSWVYWEGAISILNGQGYQDVTGNSITAWPPLYPLTLALWGSIFGLSMGSVKGLIVFMAFFNGAIWARLILKITENLTIWPRSVLLLFVLCFLPETSQSLLSEVVYFPILGLLLIGLLNHDKPYLLALHVAILTIPLTVAVLTRNQALVLVPAVILAAWLLSDTRYTKIATLAGLIAVCCWLVTRTYLGQWSAFAIQPQPNNFITELTSVLAITGAMISITKWNVDAISLVLMSVFLVLVNLPLLISVITNSPQSINAPKGVAILIFAMAIYFGTITIGLLLGMPIAQPRWFLGFVLLFCMAVLIIACSKNQSVLVWSVSAALSCIIISTSLYRATYFLIFWPNQSASLNHDFQPTRRWAQTQINEIDSLIAQGTPPELAVKKLSKPYSANTYRRWNHLPLVH